MINDTTNPREFLEDTSLPQQAEELTWAEEASQSAEEPDYAIVVEDVSKHYKLYHDKRNTLQSLFVSLSRRGKPAYEDFWALRDVSFKLKRGQSLGVIGHNGAGKSTLLKLVTGIIQPTKGNIKIDGRVSAMLELGTGFNPDLSARDNIYLNGAIYGFSKKEMDTRYEQIVEFSELERFIDTPVKHYSSGMYMRLAFSVAITVNPDIMVIDEVLAVGDASFANKCYQKLDELKANGVSMLFVSHAATEVARFCDEVIYLSRGRMVMRGAPGPVLNQYLLDNGDTNHERKIRVEAPQPVETPPETTPDLAEEESVETGKPAANPVAELDFLPVYKPVNSTVGVPLAFYPLTNPIRLLETRPGEKAYTNTGNIISAGQSLNVKARDFHFMDVRVPPEAAVLVGHLFVMPHGNEVSPGYITLYPGPQDTRATHCPPVPTLTYDNTRITSTAFSARLGPDGTMNIFSSGNAHVVIDITGYYAAPSARGLYFHTLAQPLRLFDTQPGARAHIASNKPIMPTTSYNLRGSNFTFRNMTIPPTAKALTGYITFKDTLLEEIGNTFLYPGPVDLLLERRPHSNIAVIGFGKTFTTTFTVRLGPDGTFNLQVGVPTNVIIDITGYYSEEATDNNGTGLMYFELPTPLRLLETQPGREGYNRPETPLKANEELKLSGRNLNYGSLSIPGTARALSGICTAVELADTNGAFASIYPPLSEKTAPIGGSPVVSLSLLPGQICSNQFTVRLSGGSLCLNSTSTAHYTLDVHGYFTT